MSDKTIISRQELARYICAVSGVFLMFISHTLHDEQDVLFVHGIGLGLWIGWLINFLGRDS